MKMSILHLTHLTFFRDPITDLVPNGWCRPHCYYRQRRLPTSAHSPNKKKLLQFERRLTVSFKMNYTHHKPFKAWGQFQHQGRVITAGFILAFDYKFLIEFHHFKNYV